MRKRMVNFHRNKTTELTFIHPSSTPSMLCWTYQSTKHKLSSHKWAQVTLYWILSQDSCLLSSQCEFHMSTLMSQFLWFELIVMDWGWCVDHQTIFLWKNHLQSLDTVFQNLLIKSRWVRGNLSIFRGHTVEERKNFFSCEKGINFQEMPRALVSEAVNSLVNFIHGK